MSDTPYDRNVVAELLSLIGSDTPTSSTDDLSSLPSMATPTPEFDGADAAAAGAASSAFSTTQLLSLPPEMIERILANLTGAEMRSCLAVPNAAFHAHCRAYVRHVHSVWLRALAWMDANDKRRRRITTGRHYLMCLRELHAMLQPTGRRCDRRVTDSAAEQLVLDFGPMVHQYARHMNPYAHLSISQLTERLSTLMTSTVDGEELADAKLFDFLAYMMRLLLWLWDTVLPADFGDFEPCAQIELSYCTQPFATIADYCDHITNRMTDFIEVVTARLRETTAAPGWPLGDAGQTAGLLGRAYVEAQVQIRMRDSVTSLMVYCSNHGCLTEVLAHFPRLTRLQVLNVHSIDLKMLAYHLNHRPLIRSLYLLGQLPGQPDRHDNVDFCTLPLLCFQHLDTIRMQSLEFLTPDYMRKLLFFLCRVRRILMLNCPLPAPMLAAVVAESHAHAEQYNLPKVGLVDQAQWAQAAPPEPVGGWNEQERAQERMQWRVEWVMEPVYEYKEPLRVRRVVQKIKSAHERIAEVARQRYVEAELAWRAERRARRDAECAEARGEAKREAKRVAAARRKQPRRRRRWTRVQPKAFRSNDAVVMRRLSTRKDRKQRWPLSAIATTKTTTKTTVRERLSSERAAAHESGGLVALLENMTLTKDATTSTAESDFRDAVTATEPPEGGDRCSLLSL